MMCALICITETLIIAEYIVSVCKCMENGSDKLEGCMQIDYSRKGECYFSIHSAFYYSSHTVCIYLRVSCVKESKPKVSETQK